MASPGLAALALTAYVFDEFGASAELMTTAGAALEDYARRTLLPDGGDLEQSFSYNLEFIREGREGVEIFPEGPERPGWVSALHDAMLRRERLFAGCTMPLADLPRIGTHAGGWASEAAIKWGVRPGLRSRPSSSSRLSATHCVPCRPSSTRQLRTRSRSDPTTVSSSPP